MLWQEWGKVSPWSEVPPGGLFIAKVAGEPMLAIKMVCPQKDDDRPEYAVAVLPSRPKVSNFPFHQRASNFKNDTLLALPAAVIRPNFSFSGLLLDRPPEAARAGFLVQAHAGLSLVIATDHHETLAFDVHSGEIHSNKARPDYQATGYLIYLGWSVAIGEEQDRQVIFEWPFTSAAIESGSDRQAA